MKKLIVRSIFYLFCFITAFGISCQKDINEDLFPPPGKIILINAGFEDKLNGWTIETGYQGFFGFSSSKDAVRNGVYGLNFYAPQPSHYTGAPQETPWNGKIYQIITGLKDGNYTFKTYADGVGSGMYLWANGGGPDVKVAIKSSVSEINIIDFVVTGGTAKIGFICINAGGTAPYAPYFHADDVDLLAK